MKTLKLTNKEFDHLKSILMHYEINGHSFTSVRFKQLERAGKHHQAKILCKTQIKLFNRVFGIKQSKGFK